MKNTLHTREHDLLLEAALAGDVDANDRRLLERLASCGECSAHFRELGELRELLDDAGRDERDTLAAIDTRRDVPGSERVAPFVRAMVAERTRRPSFARRALVWTASAAAGVVAIGGLVRWLLPDGDARQRNVLLGESHRSGMTPSGPVREYTPLEWNLELPAGGRYELRVWDDREGAASEPFVSELKLFTKDWIPSVAETKRWPDRIRWQVRALDATGVQVGLRTEYAQRSQP